MKIALTIPDTRSQRFDPPGSRRVHRSLYRHRRHRRLGSSLLECEVAFSLSEPDQAWLLNEAATRLRALGRLREAAAPMRAGLARCVRTVEWDRAASVAGNLSELELTLGEVKAAVTDAEQSVAYSDRSGVLFGRVTSRAKLAHARHQAGEENVAIALFSESERLQADWQPKYPLLYSLPGFMYCDLLLARVERAAVSGRDARALVVCAEVEQRAVQTLEWARQNHAPLLDFALNYLSLGRRSQGVVLFAFCLLSAFFDAG